MPQPEPAQKPALLSPQRRLALLLGIPIAILVIAVAVWAALPRTSPATTAMARTTTATSTADAPADLLSTWEQTLLNVDVRGDCDGEKAFTPDCMYEVDHVGAIARDVAKQAAKLGSRYGEVRAEADKIAGDADRWADCPRTKAYSTERWECLDTLGSLRTAGESMLARIYAVERP
ncbi:MULTISPECIES: hypothetical protein [Saccharothrix]|uniref:hypothetical protein n=1 Tax=Saccharothrix TaxID=2071 RepID=UPI00093EE37E|nr:hypothetical protein [Saccharothrix sp. CB00851]OKI38690.1 hypothetical protein A6A25_00225 [Saccharothrix sp. CB00851]